jgi:NTP pyrophosphatase (non-canonical NTP hydrolase)
MDTMEYLHESARTVSDQYHSDKVTTSELDFMLQAVITAGAWADRVKRSLFYGAELKTARIFSTTSLEHRPEMADLVHAMLGSVTEAAEMAEHVRDVLTGTKLLDKVNVIEEIGDVLWYLALGLRFSGSTFDQAFLINITKLRKRFPNKFTEAAAIERDLSAERAVLEGGVAAAEGET